MARKFTEQNPILKPLMAEVKKRREELGLTGRQAAEKAGIDQSTWWQFENGGRQPTIDSLQAMAKALGGKLKIEIGYKA